MKDTVLKKSNYASVDKSEKIANCYALRLDNNVALPLYSSGVAAGYPAVADNHVEQAISLNDLVRHPPASFLVRVQGYSMIEDGIRDGDMLIVDRALDYRNHDIVVAALQCLIGRHCHVRRRTF